MVTLETQSSLVIFYCAKEWNLSNTKACVQYSEGPGILWSAWMSSNCSTSSSLSMWKLGGRLIRPAYQSINRPRLFPPNSVGWPKPDGPRDKEAQHSRPLAAPSVWEATQVEIPGSTLPTLIYVMYLKNGREYYPLFVQLPSPSSSKGSQCDYSLFF